MNKCCIIKSKKWLPLKFVNRWNECIWRVALTSTAQWRLTPSPCHPHDLPPGTQVLLITRGFMCSISPLTLHLHLVATVSPISSPLLASYGWGSKLQWLGLELGFGVGVGVLPVPTVFSSCARCLPPPPPSCRLLHQSINQSELPDVVFYVRMCSGK